MSRQPGPGCHVKQGLYDVYSPFVQSLFSKLQPRLDAELDPDLQFVISRLIRLLTVMPREVVLDNRELFELASRVVAADKPNLVVARGVVNDLFAQYERHAGGLARMLLPLCGRTPLNAVVAALVTIVAVSFIVVPMFGFGIKFIHLAASRFGDDLDLFPVLQGAHLSQLLLAMHAAFLGCLVSIMIRIHAYGTLSVMTPLMIYLSLVTRPVVSVLFAVFVFSVVKAGLIAFHGLDLDGRHGLYVAWAIGFLCGFSERLAQDVAVGASHLLDHPAPAAARPPARSTGKTVGTP